MHVATNIKSGSKVKAHKMICGYPCLSLTELFTLILPPSLERQENIPLAWKTLWKVTKEKENIELEIEEELEGNTEGEKKAAEPPVPYQYIADLYNDICGEKMPKVIKVSDSRKKHLQARWKEVYALWLKKARPDPDYSAAKEQMLRVFESLFKKSEASSFMNGNNDRNWKADFDWMVKNNNNFAKILEGKYDNDRMSRASPDKDRASPEEQKVVDMVKNQLNYDITATKARELLKYANNNIDLIKEKILEARKKEMDPAQSYYWLENTVKKTNSLYKGYR